MEVGGGSRGLPGDDASPSRTGALAHVSLCQHEGRQLYPGQGEHGDFRHPPGTLSFLASLRLHLHSYRTWTQTPNPEPRAITPKRTPPPREYVSDASDIATEW